MPRLFNPNLQTLVEYNAHLKATLGGGAPADDLDAHVAINPVVFSSGDCSGVVIVSAEGGGQQKPVVQYKDLPFWPDEATSASYSEEQRTALAQMKSDLEDPAKPGFNGLHILVKNARVVRNDAGKSVIVLEAYQTRYHMVRAIHKDMVPQPVGLHAFGVQMPLRTTEADGTHKVLFVRAARGFKLPGAPQGSAEPMVIEALPEGPFKAGILQALKESGRADVDIAEPVLSVGDATIDLLTAMKELEEEVFGHSEEGQAIFTKMQLDSIRSVLAYHFSQGMRLPLLNVIRPVTVALTAEQLGDYLSERNVSVDSKEIDSDPDSFIEIDLSSREACQASFKQLVMLEDTKKSLHVMQMLLAMVPKSYAAKIQEAWLAHRAQKAEAELGGGGSAAPAP